MKITAIELTNIKSFKKLDKIEFSNKINILVGPNNAGKSTILHAIYKIQVPSILERSEDVTIGENNGEMLIYFEGGHENIIQNNPNCAGFRFSVPGSSRTLHYVNGGNTTFNGIPNQEPYNLIYPYLSKRKAVNFEQTINATNTLSVNGNFTQLYSKIDRLINPYYRPANGYYVQACEDILGFIVATKATNNGKQAVQYVHEEESIPLTSMGEGVANILGLITDLCVSEDRVFLIEELENDIHPKALKSLLHLISKKSESNQFFISTHSNIVMKHLGASKDSKIFRVANEVSADNKPDLKYSTLKEVKDDPIERIKILEELGYDAFDFDFWKAWLFLEESSAETLIRDFFIPWYTPNLRGKLRTFSAKSLSQVKPKFDDFNKLFVFLHLEPAYKNKVWVYIDAGENESEIINEMKVIYNRSGWNEDNFSQFSQHDFEKYYPDGFQSDVESVLAIQDKQEKRNAKHVLLLKVVDWAKSNEVEAKTKFEDSASEIIEILKLIESNI